ncbi:serine/threonine-protein kinase [Candidatus Venteria ishoeyi]|uniref:serine/threonine protein kinase n=1 Tax=Candidatus Venteria ishoeyi TaxID=1899563 RepID=UPI0025A52A95|nr:serine/threonine-protein kinase [Candidatus Venteria ishoeyi]MDM8547112.1 serine/threonine-protein kinase [Candidatus Venteria ishoeyi]
MNEIQTPQASILGERFQLQQKIRDSREHSTWQAFDQVKKQPCIIKLLAYNTANAPRCRELLAREAHLLGLLHHPRVPRLIDYQGFEDAAAKQAYLVQSQIPGKSLLQWVHGGRKFQVDEVLDIALQICDILEYLHGFMPPVVHQDLTPDNLLLSKQGHISLIDFGAAQEMSKQQNTGNTTGTAGSYGYLAPEQSSGAVRPSSDLYALGKILVFLLTGETPIATPYERCVLPQGVKLSAKFCQVLQRLQHPDWRQRYASVQTVSWEFAALKNPTPEFHWQIFLVVLMVALGLGLAWIWLR